MTGPRHACVAIAFAAAFASPAAPRPTEPSPPPQDPPPTFRSTAAAVMVDVNVRDRNGRPITKLSREDFEVRDNGVPQQIDDVSYGKLPIDVTVALDVSYSVTGTVLNQLRQGVVQLMRDLGDEDRLKLVLFNMHITRTTDFTRDVKAVERTIRDAKAGGGTALLDAVSVALVSAADPDRRQLVVFFTDGGDSSSTTTPDVLMSVAQRTRATLTFVMPGTSRAFTMSRPTAALPTVVSRTSRLAPGPLSALFSDLAAETGGSIIPVTAATNLSVAFRRVLAEFRTTYVLYYTPRGVDRTGYHTIAVEVDRDGAQVQARRGYFSS